MVPETHTPIDIPVSGYSWKKKVGEFYVELKKLETQWEREKMPRKMRFIWSSENMIV
jgi:hypothetical protein